MIGVGLVLPLMMFRWKEVGISPARLGMVGSIYSGSQLVGGLVLGKLGDRGLVEPVHAVHGWQWAACCCLARDG